MKFRIIKKDDKLKLEHLIPGQFMNGRETWNKCHIIFNCISDAKDHAYKIKIDSNPEIETIEEFDI